MKPATLLLFAANSLGLASAASLPDDGVHAVQKRGCFNSGASWGSEQDDAIAKAQSVCNTSKDNGGFKGKFLKGETRVKCYNLPNNKHTKLTLGLTGHNAGSSRSIGYDECLGGLVSEIVKCSKGGDTTYGNWRYRADPNSGKCP